MVLFLDSHTTTPLGIPAYEAMRPWLKEQFGNPHMPGYDLGRKAATTVEIARSQILDMLGDRDNHGDMVFTSGATEANNLALRGVMARRPQRKEIIISAIEHASVRATAQSLGETGAQVKIIAVDRSGRLDIDQLDNALSEHTAIVSVVHGNNEIGTLQDLTAIERLCRDKGAWLHSDATQSAWIMPPLVCTNDRRPCPALISLSSHKMYGPQGIGALWWDPARVDLAPLTTGGNQQGGMRAGTVPVMLAAGFGAAAKHADTMRASNATALASMRNMFWNKIRERIPKAVCHGHDVYRLPHNLSLSLPFVRCNSVLPMLTSRVAVSSSAACQGDTSFSHVLRAIGLRPGDKSCVLRFGFSLTLDNDDIINAAAAVVDVYEHLQSEGVRREGV